MTFLPRDTNVMASGQMRFNRSALASCPVSSHHTERKGSDHPEGSSSKISKSNLLALFSHSVGIDALVIYNPAESASTVIGDMEVPDLADIFKTTLEAWVFVDSARTQRQSFGYFRTKLDNQRAIFLIWAEKLGFSQQKGTTRRSTRHYSESARFATR